MVQGAGLPGAGKGAAVCTNSSPTSSIFRPDGQAPGGQCCPRLRASLSGSHAQVFSQVLPAPTAWPACALQATRSVSVPSDTGPAQGSGFRDEDMRAGTGAMVWVETSVPQQGSKRGGHVDGLGDSLRYTSAAGPRSADRP